MEKYFSVGEAAKIVHTTSETLRHYDRIGLVRPSRKDEWTKYRYYTNQDIVRLNTVRALQLMGLAPEFCIDRAKKEALNIVRCVNNKVISDFEI